MRFALAITAFLIFAAGSLPAASQSTTDPAMQSSAASASRTTTTSTAAAHGTPVTRTQARDQFRDAGYRHVHALLKGPDGVWHAKATKAGKPCAVALDLMGNMTTS